MEILSFAFLLFLVMDPLGNIPTFVAQLKDVEQSRVSKIILRENIIALGVLVIFLFAGELILALLHVSKPSLGIAGALILFIIAMQMVFSKHDIASENGNGPKTTEEPFIVPLAIPLVAGPSAIAVVILQMAKAPDQWYYWLGGLILAWLGSTLILLSSQSISRILGKKAMSAVEKLMGLMLVAIAVEMCISGLRDALAQ